MQDYSIDNMDNKLSFREYRRYEIHDDKIYYMAGAPTGHNYIAGNILAVFKNFLKGKKCKVFGENENVIFKKNFREYLPDVKIVCDSDKIKDDAIYGAPDLIVEILSKSTEKNDRGFKFKVYEQNGVKEYWIVDAKNKKVEVYILEDNKYKLDNIYFHFSDEEIQQTDEYGNDEEKELIKIKTMKTSLFGNDLIISIADIFENID